MFSKVKCEIPWVPYLNFIRKSTNAKSKGGKSSAKNHTFTQYKIRNLIVDLNLPK